MNAPHSTNLAGIADSEAVWQRFVYPCLLHARNSSCSRLPVKKLSHKAHTMMAYFVYTQREQPHQNPLIKRAEFRYLIGQRLRATLVENYPHLPDRKSTRLNSSHLGI